MVEREFAEAVEGYIASWVMPFATEKTKLGKRKITLLLDADEVPGFSEQAGSEFHRIMGGIEPSTGKEQYIKFLVRRLRHLGLRVKYNGYPAIRDEGIQTWVWLLKVKW